MDIDAQKVIDNLGQKVATLSIEVATLQAMLQTALAPAPPEDAP